MNLFRSEEHVEHWSEYDAESEDAIMPLTDWAKVFGGPLFATACMTLPLAGQRVPRSLRADAPRTREDWPVLGAPVRTAARATLIGPSGEDCACIWICS